MAMTITCADMGYSCGYEITGDSLDQILGGVKNHAYEFHGYAEDELDSPEKLEAWKGAIRQSARPGVTRVPRDESDRDIVPH